MKIKRAAIAALKSVLIKIKNDFYLSLLLFILLNMILSKRTVKPHIKIRRYNPLESCFIKTKYNPIGPNKINSIQNIIVLPKNFLVRISINYLPYVFSLLNKLFIMIISLKHFHTPK